MRRKNFFQYPFDLSKIVMFKWRHNTQAQSYSADPMFATSKTKEKTSQHCHLAVKGLNLTQMSSTND